VSYLENMNYPLADILCFVPGFIPGELNYPLADILCSVPGVIPGELELPSG